MQESFLIWLAGFQHAMLNPIAYFFTFMGNELFYFLIIPFVYLCLSKEIGFRLIYVFLVSMYVNTYIKINTEVLRPVEVDGVKPLFIESTDSHYYPYDSFPSGHAQGSTTLWGYLAYHFQSRALWLIAILLIFFISFSRLYAGLHWPVDIISGILLAIIILLISIRLEKVVRNMSRILQWILAVAFPVLLFVIFPYDNGAKYAGFLLGAGISYLLEQKYVQMKISPIIWRKLLGFTIMLVGLLGLQAGLKALLPETDIFNTLRYAVMAVWGFIIVPWLLIKLRLNSSGKVDSDQSGDPPVWA